jgi:signal transduction histidine kinase
VETQLKEMKLQLRDEPSLLNEYNDLIEELRTRLNILNTSLFLLRDSFKQKDPKLTRYLKKINKEMEKIRQLILRYPKYSIK